LEAVARMHQNAPSQNDGPELEHLDDETNRKMAFAAGLMHSTDRKVPADVYVPTLHVFLALCPQFTATQKEVILEAVMRHDEYKDKEVRTRSLIQQALMDADKIINLQALVIIRSARFNRDIPAIEPQFIGKRKAGARYNNPASTYRTPTSVLEDLRGCSEWAEPGWMHFDAAYEEAARLAKLIDTFIDESERVYIEMGLAGHKL
jgi:hypothetical protein